MWRDCAGIMQGLNKGSMTRRHASWSRNLLLFFSHKDTSVTLYCSAEMATFYEDSLVALCRRNCKISQRQFSRVVLQKLWDFAKTLQKCFGAEIARLYVDSSVTLCFWNCETSQRQFSHVVMQKWQDSSRRRAIDVIVQRIARTLKGTSLFSRRVTQRRRTSNPQPPPRLHRHTHVHACTHTHARTHTHTHTHTHTQMHIYARTRMSAHTHTHARCQSWFKGDQSVPFRVHIRIGGYYPSLESW